MVSSNQDLDLARQELAAAERTVCALQLHGVDVTSLHRLLQLSRSFVDELEIRRSGRARFPVSGGKR